MSAYLFIGAITDKMTLLPTFKALACLVVLFAFLVICGFADNGGRIHGVIISGRKMWSRGLCAISQSVPVLIIGTRVVASSTMPDPSSVLSWSLSLNAIAVGGSVFQMECLCLQVDLLLTLDHGSPLFVGFGVFHFNASISQRSWKSQGKGSKI